MGLAIFVSVLLYAAVAFAVVGTSVLSAVRCRRIPLFWVAALACAALGPIVLSAPIPVSRGGADGWVGYLLEAVFTKFNLIYFFGAGLSALVAAVPNSAIQALSAASWGLASSFAVRTFHLLGY
jgi:hypothetical protein